MYPDASSTSARLYERARATIPDGASRGLVLWSPYPVYVESGLGAWVTDVDGNRYLDCNNNFTSIILGHADPAVNAAVVDQLGRGSAFAMATEAEIRLAELLCDRIDSVERVRFCNSGTEAVMQSIKAARAFTGRPDIVKVEGAYHGTYDHAELSLGSDPSNWGPASAPASVRFSRGAPGSVSDEVGVIGFNDPDAARTVIRRHGGDLAAVLLDSMPSRVGMPAVRADFLDAVMSTAAEVGALVILDEVITLRLGPGGNQGLLGIEPDLTVMAKIIGGGFPVGAVGGRADVMDVFSRAAGERPAVSGGGTFSANSVTMTAGHACMSQLGDDEYRRLDEIGAAARAGIAEQFASHRAPWQVTGAGSLFRIHPHDRPIENYRDARHTSDEEAVMGAFGRVLLDEQVYLSTYGLGCLNLATGDDDVAHLVEAVGTALHRIRW